MNITVEQQPECTASLRAEIPADHVSKERKGIIKAYGAQAKIPGFRPGKIPASILEKRFGDSMKEELESRLINSAIQDALKENEDLKVIHFKTPESMEHNDDGSFTFVLPMILAPTFELPEYKGIEVKIPSADATEEELQHEMDELLARYADYNSVEDRSLEAGDIAVIDFTSTLDGTPLEEAIGKPAGILAGKEDYWVKLQDDAFLPGFSKQLEGAAAGESLEVTCAVGEDFPMEELQGKNLVLAVTVKEIKEQVLPELNDEFVSDTLQLQDKSVEDLKELISEQINQQKAQKINESKVNQLIETLIARVDFDLPQDLIDSEAQTAADDMVARGAESGLSDEEIQAQQGDIIATAQIQARNNLKTNFILQEIAKVENIEVNDTDLAVRISEMAQQANKPIKKYFRELQKADQIGSVKNSIQIGKVIDFLVENADIQEVAEDTNSEETTEEG